MITDVYFPRINGVSTSIKTFHRELTGLGYEITLIAPDYGQGPDREAWIHRVPSYYLPVDPEDRVMKKNLVYKLFEERLCDRHFDLIHIQTPFVAYYAGMHLSKRLGIPVVVTCHTHFEEYFYHYLPWLPKSLLRYLARWFNHRQCNVVDGLVVPSAPMQDVMAGYGVKKPMSIIATGIEERFFLRGDRERFRNRYGIDTGRPVLVHISRVAHEKNIDFLIHMLACLRKSVPDILLIIAGEGPAKKHLENLVKKGGLQDHVIFVGYLDRSTTLLDCYQAGDIFVFASKTETQGLVLLEAMAQGIPVVSLSAMGTHDILKAGRGAVIAGDDACDFSQKVRQLIENKALREHMGREGVTYARSWSARDFAVKKGLFYEKIVLDHYPN